LVDQNSVYCCPLCGEVFGYGYDLILHYDCSFNRRDRRAIYFLSDFVEEYGLIGLDSSLSVLECGQVFSLLWADFRNFFLFEFFVHSQIIGVR
jgi:hypothetical protein